MRLLKDFRSTPRGRQHLSPGVGRRISWRRRHVGPLVRVRQAWFRIFGCGICHRTGVVMNPGCECKPSWGIESCEPCCGTVPCPRYCRVAASRDEALAVWRRHWPPRLLTDPPEVITEDDDALDRALAALSAENAAGAERRRQRFHESMRLLETDPAERARIERIAREAGMPVDRRGHGLG